MSAPGAYAKGTPIIRKFPFAFDTPGLLTGHTVYTPRVGDVLLDAWIEVDTAWDGTTPLCDIGTFVGGPDGVLGSIGAATIWPLDQLTWGPNASWGHGISAPVHNGFDSVSQAQLQTPNIMAVPATIAVANPIKVVVSQDGTNTGGDPGSAQGSAVLYLVTATPL